LHRVAAGEINGILTANYMSFLDTCNLDCDSPQLCKKGIRAVASLHLADLGAKVNDLKHAITTLYINNGTSKRTTQFLLSGLCIYASSSLHVLTVTADSTRWLVEGKPLLSVTDAEGSELLARKHAQIMRRRREVKIDTTRQPDCRVSYHNFQESVHVDNPFMARKSCAALFKHIHPTVFQAAR